MVDIGGYPILWHIMKIYSAGGLNEFIVCLGYKGYVIKEYFANYFLHTADVTFDMARNKMEVHQYATEPWLVTLVDTGKETATGGRIKRIDSYLDGEEFCLTYGDGVAAIDIKKLIDFHHQQKRLATLTAVRPPGRFGALEIEANQITTFREKPEGDGGWINGGFFVLSRRVMEYIDGDHTVWERQPLERLAAERQLSAFQHSGFWLPMDTLRDKNHLEELWRTGKAPWKLWA